MNLQVKSKVGLEYMTPRVGTFSEGTDVDGACDWPAARLAEGQIGLCELRDGHFPRWLVRKVEEEPWKRRFPEPPRSVVLIEDQVALRPFL